MTVATLASGQTVLRAVVPMPASRAWTADVVLEGTHALEGSTVLRLGTAHFVGTIRRCSSFAGRTGLRLVGGAGGLATEIPARAYSQTPLDLPLRHALEAAGERLSPLVSAALLARPLARWTRLAAPLARELDALALAAGPGVTWRVLDTGEVWMGEETWPTRAMQGELLDEDLDVGRRRIAPSAPSLRPGDTWAGTRCGKVTHVWTPDGLRTEAWAPLPDKPSTTDPYAHSYPARIVTQHGDGTVDLSPDSAAVPSLTGVPLRLGVPGLRVELHANQRCRLHFDGGSPQRPYAALSDAEGNLQFGSLVVVTNTTVGAVVTILFFEGGLQGSLLALAAVAALTPPLVGVIVPLTVGTAAVV